ncbi:hypothetical protein J6590_053501 [Homalodisca vitripennis]|nr:hypothetical protein J6590_053501 [Homalodisca vitripennis]
MSAPPSPHRGASAPLYPRGGDHVLYQLKPDIPHPVAALPRVNSIMNAPRRGRICSKRLLMPSWTKYSGWRCNARPAAFHATFPILMPLLTSTIPNDNTTSSALLRRVFSTFPAPLFPIVAKRVRKLSFEIYRIFYRPGLIDGPYRPGGGCLSAAPPTGSGADDGGVPAPTMVTSALFLTSKLRVFKQTRRKGGDCPQNGGLRPYSIKLA